VNPPITVHEAQISTATIEIKTLTIGRKQVTLAVFRQLQRERLIDEGGDFLGVPWGTVNYHSYCYRTEDDRRWAFGDRHLHVVWQKGDELRQAVVSEPVDMSYEDREWRYHSPHADHWLIAAILTGWRPSGGLGERLQQDSWRVIRYDHDHSLGCIPAHIKAVHPLLDALHTRERIGADLHAHGSYGDGKPCLTSYSPADPTQDAEAKAWFTQEAWTQAAVLQNRLIKAGFLPPDWMPEDLVAAGDRAWRHALAYARHVDDYGANLLRRWAELKALPQLFIAA
jgi:hypothetical protein